MSKPRGYLPQFGGTAPFSKFFWPQIFRNRLVKSFQFFVSRQIFGRCMQQLKKIWGSFDLFRRYGGLNFEILGGINYTKFSPSFVDQSRLFFIPWKHKANLHKTLLIYHCTSRLRFGVTRGSNFWIFCWKFVTSFICIFDKLPTNRFSYKFYRRRAFLSSFEIWSKISNLTTRFRDKGAEKILGPPCYLPQFLMYGAQMFPVVRYYREPYRYEIFWSYPY